jgi:hypothetical protein
MKNHKWIFGIVGLLIIVGLGLAACKSGVSQANTTRQPTLVPTSPPTAVDLAELALGHRLNINPAAISIVSAEPVEWPDACLEIPADGQACAQVLVPGYLVILEAEKHLYAYHTNTDGTELRAVPGPTPPLGGIGITWQADNQCQAAVITQQGVTYGPCDGEMKTAPLPNNGEKQDLDGFANTYAPVYVETNVGRINLAGRGDDQASPAEQRMLAEWARLTVESATLGDTETLHQPAIAWHREGGIAGFCDDLTVNVAGEATSTSCKDGTHQELGQARLNGQQLAQLYGWVDTLQSFEVVQTEPANADKMTVQLSFTGRGTREATPMEQQAIGAFAAQLFAEGAGTGVPQSLGDPDQVVNDFLNSLQQDPTGQSSLDYLSQSQRAFTESGHPLTETFGLEGIYRSFAVGTTYFEEQGELATVQATLNYVSPIERSFVLVQEQGAWRVNTIIAYAVPPMTISPDFVVSDRVILAYIQALQKKDVPAAWALLTSDDEYQVSEADIAAETGPIQNITPVSITMIKATGSQLVYQVNLWVTVKSGEAGPWTEGENVRWFEMVPTPEGWGIASVSSSAP